MTDLYFRYYLEAVSSRQGGGLKLNINTKMYSTTLNGKTSKMVKTEIQEIEISSTVIPESFVSGFFIISHLILTIKINLFLLRILITTVYLWLLLMALVRYNK